MGRAAKLKQMRKIAMQLPEIKVRGIERIVLSGSELRDKGITQVQGQNVVDAKNYVERKTVPVPLNHKKQMKRAYDNSGVNGVNGYILAVTNLSEKQHASN